MKPTNQILDFFAVQIKKELGIVYAEHNYFQLQNRLENIAKQMGISDLQKLHDHAAKGIAGQFRQLLMDSATNNETSFFRDPKIFTAIEKSVLPWFLKSKVANERLRIWSAASSSGQEALSTAMTVHEFNDKTREKLQFDIHATDISERILQKARAARYSALEAQRGLTPVLMDKYFRKDTDGTCQALPILCDRISYKTQNLKDSFAVRDKFHLVLCRNVLIYQTVEGKKEILARLTETLVPDGYLILGAGESLIGLSEDYVQTPVEGAVLYRRKTAAAKAA